MKNYKQPGDVLTLTAPSGGVVSGTPYLIGGQLVVATHSADEGEDFAGKRSGVFSDLPKDTGAAWTQGELLYWDPGNDELTTAADIGNIPVGVAAEAALMAATTGTAFLHGVALPAVVEDET